MAWGSLVQVLGFLGQRLGVPWSTALGLSVQGLGILGPQLGVPLVHGLGFLSPRLGVPWSTAWDFLVHGLASYLVWLAASNPSLAVR